MVKLWRYDIPSGKYGGWATVVMGSDGYFSAVSDYGNYAYRWTHHGKADFRIFVYNLTKSPSYAAEKLGGPHAYEYDPEITKKRIKEYILEYRRCGDMSKDEAMVEWDMLGLCDDSFDRWTDCTSIKDPYEFYRKRIGQDLMNFCNLILPQLWTLVEKDLIQEGLLEVEQCAK